jgi:beta-aspartyl-peptidase (threonine type)
MKFALALLTLAVSSCSSGSSTNDERMIQEVRAVMTAQQTAWNRGDLEGFMDGYDRAETTTFVSGDEITRGWQTVLDRYKRRYQSQAQMGTLTFSELEIKPVGEGFAVADGSWRLKREHDAPHGRFTLLFHRNNGNWRIIHDTTTSGTP